MPKIESIKHEGKTIYLIGPTKAALAVLETLHEPTDADERMGLIIGEPGMGKTTAARIFAGRHNDVVYIDLPPRSAMQAPAAPLRLTEAALGIRYGSDSTIMGRLNHLIDQLRQRPRMLVLDTAHRLRYDHIDIWRYCHDQARIPVVFLSVPALRPMFEQHREFGSRLHRARELKAPTKQEIAPLLPGLSEEVIADIHARTGGRIREILQLARVIRASRKESGRAWTAQDTDDIARIFTLSSKAA